MLAVNCERAVDAVAVPCSLRAGTSAHADLCVAPGGTTSTGQRATPIKRGRNAAEERGFECAASTGAYDDHLSFFLVGEVGEPLGWVADDNAPVCLFESHCSALSSTSNRVCGLFLLVGCRKRRDAASLPLARRRRRRGRGWARRRWP